MVLSSFIILMVSSTFLVQNNYYSSQVLRTGAHDNARVATELVSSEIRGAVSGGFVVAGARTLTVRSPVAAGVVCNRFGAGTADIYTDGGQAAIDEAEVAGVARRNPSTGAWTFVYAAWSWLDTGDALSASSCYANGADTVGASGEFHRLTNLATVFATVPAQGELVMLFRETTFGIGESVLEPGTLALFRQPYGVSAVEFATGIDSTAQFQYRTGGTTYADTISSGFLGDIDAVRIVAGARKRAQTGGRDDLTFGWSVNVAVRNVR